LRVGQRSQTLVIFLSSSIPKAEADGLAVDHDASGVVVETAY
jgi:hypothetical protein